MTIARFALLVVATTALDAAPVAAGTLKCPRDSVAVGPVCVDRYENTAWRVPAGQKSLIAKLRAGKATLTDLKNGGATQVCAVPLGNDTCGSCTFGPSFPDNGNWTEPIYAASIPGVLPTTCITWFQAEQACRLVGKRLVTNQEWQAAAAGTPDPGAADDLASTCNTNTEAPAFAGARTACVSTWGANDMVGNVWEWVGDWGEIATGCTSWDTGFGDDMTCLGPNVPQTPAAQTPSGLGGAPAPYVLPPPHTDIFPINPSFPGAIIRGGNFAAGTRNGVFAIYGGAPPNNRSRSTGFRCAR